METPKNRVKAPEMLGKREVVGHIADQTGMSQRDIEHILNTYHDTVMKMLGEGYGVRIIGFGKFVPRLRRAYTSRNPQTGEPVEVSERVEPRFHAGSTFKRLVRSYGRIILEGKDESEHRVD